MGHTALILGDQLMRENPALEGAERVLLVESLAMVRSPRRHRQRLHLVWSGMRHLAEELRERGLEVEEVRAAESLGAALAERGWPARADDDGSAAGDGGARGDGGADGDGSPEGADGANGGGAGGNGRENDGDAEGGGQDDHAPQDLDPTDLVCAAPLSRGGRALLERHGVRMLAGNQLLTDTADFARWADGREATKMEDFYREQRRRHGVLLESGGPDDDVPTARLGDAPDGEPTGGRWNFDSENRKPPKQGLSAPSPYHPRENEIDAEVRADIDRLVEDGAIEPWGEDAPRRFAVTPDEARRALDDFLDHRLADFGPWQDAMVDDEPWLFHSLLSVPLNLGVLDPLEVVRKAEARYREGEAPIESVEGFVRQVLGWREYVWGMYWWRSSWERDNGLRAQMDLPDAWWGQETGWRCLDTTVEAVRTTGYAHHIERLMVLGMLALTAGVRPWQVTKWFEGSFVDGAEWVMAPNSTGMILYADGGAMVTKPYAAGGAYVNRMSQHCGSCPYSPSEKHGEKACPVTALYWDFVQRHASTLQANRRTQMAVRTWERFDEDTQKAVRMRARRARKELREGRRAAPDEGLFAD